MSDALFDSYADAAACSGWGPCSECGIWQPTAGMTEVDGVFVCSTCQPALAVDLGELRKNVGLLAEAEGLSMLEAITLLQTGAAAAGEEAVLEALCVLKREHIPGLGQPALTAEEEQRLVALGWSKLPWPAVPTWQRPGLNGPEGLWNPRSVLGGA